MTFRNFFRLKRLLRWRRVGLKPTQTTDSFDKGPLYKLVSQPEFDQFLEFLALTVDDKANILTTMNLFEPKQVQEAIKIQYAMRGIAMVADIAEELKRQAKEEGKKNEI